ncbi:Ig-like domain-containing protein [Leucobacter sp. GX24907]
MSQGTMRKRAVRLRSLIAAATTALLVATGLAVAPVAAQAVPAKATLKLTVTQAENNLSITSDVANIPLDSPGVYVTLIEKGTLADVGEVNPYAKLIRKAEFVNQAGSATLTIPVADVDRSKSYEVIAWPHMTFPTETNLYASADANFDWDALFPVATATSVKFSKSSTKYNTANTATVTVRATEGNRTPSGKVQLRVPGQTLTGTLTAGKATFKLTKAVNVGTHTATASFPESKGFLKSSKSTTFKVTKTTPKVATKLVKSKVKTTQYPQVKVAVSIPGSLKAKASKYTVAVYDGKKKIKTQKLSTNGTATVKLKKMKAGSHKIKVKVAASKNANSKTSSTKTLKVVK